MTSQAESLRVCGHVNPDYPELSCTYPKGHGPVIFEDDPDDDLMDHGNQKGAYWNAEAPVPARAPLGDATHVLMARTDGADVDEVVRQIASTYIHSDVARFAINDFRDWLLERQQPAPAEGPSTPALTDDQNGMLVAALYHYMYSRMNYRDSTARSLDSHEDCCATSAARRAELDREYAGFQREIDTIQSVLDIYE